MELNQQFQAAADRVNNLPGDAAAKYMTELYGLYKQATEGDVAGDRPGGFDFKAIAKYDAWTGLRGTSKDAARQQYVDLVKVLSA